MLAGSCLAEASYWIHDLPFSFRSSLTLRNTICLFRFSVSVCVILTLAAGAPAAERPNVVWLVSEDNSIHFLKMFDDHGAETPRIAELAAHGLTFDHAFSNAPVCSVARTTLATGCYGPRIGTQFHRKSVSVPMPDGVRMFPEYLRTAGYYTANNNKTDYNAIPGKEVWDDSSRKATWRNRGEGQPFFYMQSFGVCHESCLHFSQKKMQNEKTETDPSDVFVAPYHPQTDTFRYTYARYHDRIKDMDRQIGAVVDELKEDGLLEDTFIFYFGDHGGVLPKGKGYAYESGLHVPLVVRIPQKWRHLVDAEVGSRQKGFVSFIDFGPTVLNLAGVAVPDGVDGTPFLGDGISQQDLDARDEAFGYADRFDEKYDLVRTLRKGRFEYIRNFQSFNFDGLQNNYRYRMLAYQEWRKLFQAGELNELQSEFFLPRPPEQLYDIEADPYETKNLADDPAYADVLVDLRARLVERMKSMPDLSMYPESVLAEYAFNNPVKFGKTIQANAAELIDIANLSVQEFEEARKPLFKALSSTDPSVRYWALIVASQFLTKQKGIVEKAKDIAESDPRALVRVQAAAYLALIEAQPPQAVILSALRDSSSALEAGLMLNTLTMLRDGAPGYDFEISPATIPRQFHGDDTVKRRLEYLTAP